MEYKQREGSGMAFYSAVIDMQLPYYKRVIQMAQIKWALLICDILGIPTTILGIAANLNNVRSTILFFVALLYLMCRTYFYVVKQKQSVREKDIELWHKEQDKQDRIKNIKS